jgi:hypothetical protein
VKLTSEADLGGLFLDRRIGNQTCHDRLDGAKPLRAYLGWKVALVKGC